MSVLTLHHGRARRPVNGLPAPNSVLPVALAVTARLVRPALFPLTDKPREETVMNDLNSQISNYERHREARARISISNKSTVFDALTAANITQVLVDFDGEGDSGQIDSVTAYHGEERFDFPAPTIAIQQLA
jgi:hypothetical protein